MPGDGPNPNGSRRGFIEGVLRDEEATDPAKAVKTVNI